MRCNNRPAAGNGGRARREASRDVFFSENSFGASTDRERWCPTAYWSGRLVGHFHIHNGDDERVKQDKRIFVQVDALLAAR